MDLKDRLKYGFRNLTVAQRLNAKLWGIRGQIVGLIMAMFFISFGSIWYFNFFLGFTVFLMMLEHIGTTQQYERTKFIEARIPNIKNSGGK